MTNLQQLHNQIREALDDLGDTPSDLTASLTDSASAIEIALAHDPDADQAGHNNGEAFARFARRQLGEY